MLEERVLIFISSVPAAAARRKSKLYACNLLFTVMCRGGGAETMNVDFFKEEVSTDLNGYYTYHIPGSKLKGKYFEQLYSIFHFVAASVNGVMAEEQQQPVTHVHTSFSELRHPLDS